MYHVLIQTRVKTIKEDLEMPQSQITEKKNTQPWGREIRAQTNEDTLKQEVSFKTISDVD